MKTLPNNFYVFPKSANATMPRKELKEILLSTGGWIMACGYMWDIVSKHIGAGVYRVSLKMRD